MSALILTQIAGDTWYFPSPTNIGVYAKNGEAVLIDSGNDKEAGRQVLKALGARGWKLRAILCTHSNADHIGGNAFLQQRTGCRVYATAEEAPFINNPLLEPALLFGGYPFPALRNKFLVAEPSQVTDILAPSGAVEALGVETFPLPGHYLGMVGVRTPDDVLFLADGYFSEAIISKHGIFYLFDVAAQRQTLSRLEGMKATWFLASHDSLRTEIAAAVSANRRRIEEICTLILGACTPEASAEDVEAALCQAFGIQLNANQHVLTGSAARSYLSSLAADGRLEVRFREGRALWATVNAAPA